MESFSFSISAGLTPSWLLEALEHPPGMPPPTTSTEASVSPDTTPPDTKIFKRVLKRRQPIFIFRLRSSEPGSHFVCKLDRRRLHRCRAHLRLKRLKPRRHVLRAWAIDAAGNRDPTPAIAHFRVPRTRIHHRRHRRHHRRATNPRQRVKR